MVTLPSRSYVSPCFRSVRLHLLSIMSVSAQAAARCCRQIVRPTASLRLAPTTYLSQRTLSRRWQSTEAEAAAAPANPKITQIVDQISQLTLLETADLVSTLKVRCFAPPDLCRKLRIVPISGCIPSSVVD